MPDLGKVYDLVKPKLVVPMHGERRHLVAHAEFARSRGARSIVVANGQMLDVGEGKILPEESGGAGRVFLDGNVLFGSEELVLRDRRRLAREGIVSLSVMLSGGCVKRGGVRAVLCGLPAKSLADPARQISREVERELDGQHWSRSERESELETAVKTYGGRAAKRLFGKRPVIGVAIHWA